MVDLGLIYGFVDVSMDFVENGGVGASPITTSVWCKPFVNVSQKNIAKQTTNKSVVRMIFRQVN